MTKAITYNTKTAQWLIDHADELSYIEFSHALSMLNLAVDAQTWGTLNHRRFYTKAQVQALNTISDDKLADVYGKAAEDAGLDYSVGIKLFSNDKNTVDGLTLRKLKAIDAPLQDVMNEAQGNDANTVALGRELKTLMDRVEVLAASAASNAWRLAYIVQSLLLNEKIIQAGGEPGDTELTIDGITENLETIASGIPTVTLGMNAAGAWNLELKLLSKHFNMQVLNDMDSRYLGRDASFPVLASLSKALERVIIQKLKNEFAGKTKKEAETALNSTIERYAPLLGLATLQDAPAINDGNLAEAQKMVDQFDMSHPAHSLNQLFDYILEAMNKVDKKGGKSGEITEKD